MNIDLNEYETKLYEQIKLEDELKRETLNLSPLLMESLLNRKAIPIQRLKYFIDKDYNIGRSNKSKIENFSSNCTKKDIFSHPLFIKKYLKYFINGANVSKDIYNSGKKFINETPYSDDAALAFINYLKIKKPWVRSPLSKLTFAEEIFKLTIDLGYELEDCKKIRAKIVQSK